MSVLRMSKGKAIVLSALVIIAAATFSGFAGDIGRTLMYRLPSGDLGAAPYYGGPVSLEERILNSDVIARVRLLSMSPTVEAFYSESFEDNGEWIEDTAYGSALEVRFGVIEYLKGGGGSEIVGIVRGNDFYESRLGALSPATDLNDYRLDFIALDGSVALRLDFDDAAETMDDDDVATLAWGVCEQPWVDGDLLMLRIAEGIPGDDVAATNDEECLASDVERISAPAAVPTPGPTPEPTATPAL